MNEFSVMAQLGILVARPGALIAGAPAFGGAFAPAPVRMGLAVVVAILLVPAVPTAVIASPAALVLVLAREMAIGALETLGGQVAVAVTGIAGPDGAQPGKPVGTVWFGWAWRDGDEIETRVAMETFHGDREAVRRQTVVRALDGILRLGG